mmetsp:Transcript_7418/g.14146  ORF Transcript_7418/g.14146 Transcript_7418/m.14146 type:complete len:212 (+) Transcript_7418:436-1071(+)
MAALKGFGFKNDLRLVLFRGETERRLDNQERVKIVQGSLPIKLGAAGCSTAVQFPGITEINHLRTRRQKSHATLQFKLRRVQLHPDGVCRSVLHDSPQRQEVVVKTTVRCRLQSAPLAHVADLGHVAGDPDKPLPRVRGRGHPVALVPVDVNVAIHMPSPEAIGFNCPVSNRLDVPPFLHHLVEPIIIVQTQVLQVLATRAQSNKIPEIKP